MSKVYLALYKGRKSGRGLNVAAARFADWVIRTITRSLDRAVQAARSRPA